MDIPVVEAPAGAMKCLCFDEGRGARCQDRWNAKRREGRAINRRERGEFLGEDDSHRRLDDILRELHEHGLADRAMLAVMMAMVAVLMTMIIAVIGQMEEENQP